VRYFVEVFKDTAPREVLVDKNRRMEGIRTGDEIALVFNDDDVRLFPADGNK
jgi:hypothetical protein